MYEEIYNKIEEECTFRNFSAGSIKPVLGVKKNQILFRLVDSLL